MSGLCLSVTITVSLVIGLISPDRARGENLHLFTPLDSEEVTTHKHGDGRVPERESGRGKAGPVSPQSDNRPDVLDQDRFRSAERTQFQCGGLCRVDPYPRPGFIALGLPRRRILGGIRQPPSRQVFRRRISDWKARPPAPWSTSPSTCIPMTMSPGGNSLPIRRTTPYGPWRGTFMSSYKLTTRKSRRTLSSLHRHPPNRDLASLPPSDSPSPGHFRARCCFPLYLVCAPTR